MKAKRMAILMSPSTVVDMGRSIRFLFFPRPITWKNEHGHEVSMDGQSICTEEFLSEYSLKVEELTGKRIESVFQFRACDPSHVTNVEEIRFLAKGTIRKPFNGLTTWEEFLVLAEQNSWETFQCSIPDGEVDLIIDSNSMKEFPAEITRPTILEIPGDFIRFHRADDHTSKTSLCGSQLTRHQLLQTGFHHGVLDQLANGEREGYEKLLRLEKDSPLKQKLHRAVVRGLPIQHHMLQTLETIYTAKYTRNHIVNTKHRCGSRFLCTDPKVQKKHAIVPEQYLPRKRKDEIYAWISTPIVDTKCVRRIKFKNISTHKANVIIVDAHTALEGHRDFDGDLTKIINLRRAP